MLLLFSLLLLLWLLLFSRVARQPCVPIIHYVRIHSKNTPIRLLERVWVRGWRCVCAFALACLFACSLLSVLFQGAHFNQAPPAKRTTNNDPCTRARARKHSCVRAHPQAPQWWGLQVLLITCDGVHASLSDIGLHPRCWCELRLLFTLDEHS